jgi:hypothetical protein
VPEAQILQQRLEDGVSLCDIYLAAMQRIYTILMQKRQIISLPDQALELNSYFTKKGREHKSPRTLVGKRIVSQRLQ